MSLPQAICILGMHRSGTSCLTGSLQQAGLFLGEVSEKNPHNLKGNREHPLIMALNEDVLRANGGSWDIPPSTVIWTDELKTRRDEIIGMIAQAEPWGFKDPRTLLTLNGWQEAVPNMRFASTFRSPMSVAESLKKSRSKFPIERGIALWKQYNQILLDVYNRQPFPMICFDVTQEVFLEKLALLCEKLGLDAGAAKRGDTFFSEELRHENSVEAECADPEATEIYEALKARSL